MLVTGLVLLVVGAALVALSSVIRVRNLGGGRPVDWSSRTQGLSGPVVLAGVGGGIVALVGGLQLQQLWSVPAIVVTVVAAIAVPLLVPLVVHDRRVRRG